LSSDEWPESPTYTEIKSYHADDVVAVLGFVEEASKDGNAVRTERRVLQERPKHQSRQLARVYIENAVLHKHLRDFFGGGVVSGSL
jgi:hypothetical protein